VPECEADAMNEYEAIVIIAAVFIVFYIVGSVRNRRLLVGYSQAIKKHIGSISEFVGFRPYGSSGFRALGNMKKEIPLSKMEIAVSLVDRENVMHYPLALITNEHDKITVWGFLRRTPGLSLEICSRKDHASFQKQRVGLALTETVMGGQELEALFRVSSSDRARATGILLDNELQDRLRQARNSLRYLLIDERESRVFLTGKLTSESLGPLLDLVILSGKKAL